MIKRGDIYWINQSAYEKQGEHVLRTGRPGVIVSADRFNKRNFNYEVVLLTTSTKFDEPTHVTIRSAREVSTAICEQIQTVSTEQVGDFIGSCTQKEMEAIDAALEISLSLIPTVTSGTIWTDDDEESDMDVGVTTTATSEDDADDRINLTLLETDTYEENLKLREDLAKAKHGEELLREMYNELLLQTLKVDNPEKRL